MSYSPYEWCRVFFLPRPDAGEIERISRPIMMSTTASLVELPFTMFWLNIKNRMMVENRSFSQITKQIRTEEGIKGFYYGTSAEILRLCWRQIFRGPATVFMKPALESYFPHAPSLSLALTSGLAVGIGDAIWSAPIESWKVYQTTKKKGTSYLQPYKPFAGLHASVMRQSLAWALCFTVTDGLQCLMKSYYQKNTLTYAELAMIAPLVSMTFIVPPHLFDMIKTRSQASNISPDKVPSASLFKAMKHLIQNEGMSGAVRGVGPSIVQRTPLAWWIMAMQQFYREAKNDPKPPPSLTELLDITASSFSKPPEAARN